jgi:TorA maturation chaperone TorD
VIELLRALAVLSEAPVPATAAVTDALGLILPTPDEYTDAFLFQLYPYASVYLGAEGMIGGEARDRIAGFWRALRLTPPAEPDHLAALLGLYVSLGEEEAAEPVGTARRVLVRQARKALLWEHLLSWLPAYLDHMEVVAASSYRRWASLLRRTLAAEAADLGPPDQLPRHLDEAPGLPDPRVEGADPFLAGLLAPVRTGFILVRADLARAARDLGLGLRLAERSYTLRALFGQDREATLTWFADEALRATSGHPVEQTFSPVTGFWRERAAAAAALLGDLSQAAKEASYVV